MKEVDGKILRERESHISNEYGGVYPPFEVFYIYSIIYAAQRSEDAFARFDSSCLSGLGADAIASAVHEALSHAAALSRFFWPSRSKGVSRARAQKLRDAFGVNDESPLRDRRLRDALEHFDEKLDNFLLTDPVGYLFPSAIIDNHTLADNPVSKFFKLVDPEQEYFVLFGEKYRFGEIRREVQHILALGRNMYKLGGRLKPAGDGA